jgi:aminocarboxymuconate-semialdehyde decarboxylase
LEASQGQIWIDSLVHDPDLMEYVIRKLGPGGADRIVLGSDYPFPLGEVPVAGKMLTEDERLGRFMSWGERAGVLARNAIRFLKLGREFEDRFEERLRQFTAAGVLLVGGQVKDGGWDAWKHRDSAIDLDGDDEGRVGNVAGRDAERSPGSIGSQ